MRRERCRIACKLRDQVPVCCRVCVSFVSSAWVVGLVWISIKWYGLFKLGYKFVAGVKTTSVGMKWIVFCINTLSKSIKTLSKVMKSKLVYEKIIAIWKNINGIKIYHSYKTKPKDIKIMSKLWKNDKGIKISPCCEKVVIK